MRIEARFYLILLFFFIASLTYRMYGALHNYPFWVDEFSTASQAREVLEHGLRVFRNPAIHFEPHNALYHFIIAFFFKSFGQSESVARLPAVIVGSFIPVLVFILGLRIFNLGTGAAAGLLATTSYFLITWSRQARSYVFVQFFILLVTYFYIKIVHQKQKSPLNIFLLSSFSIVGILTHSFFYIFLLALIIHFVLTHIRHMQNWMRHPGFYIVTAVGFVAAQLTGFLPAFIAHMSDGIIKSNNVWYYHSFLWREYGLITYLAALGLFLTSMKYKKIFFLIALYISFHLVFINFSFEPYVSRYLLPIWPFILLAAAYALSNIANIASRKFKVLSKTAVTIILAVAIIANGHKFANKPRSFYSVNHDFREIALVDYHKVYGIIKKKGNLELGQTAVIDTWYDRLYWYLGQDFKHAYMFRWIDEEGTVNGLVKRTDFTYNDRGEKVILNLEKLRFIGELSDLKHALETYPSGFIFIDDASMPKDVIDYAKKNFKEELYLDHYPLDDNPHSIWPATLYSWGMES